jgi:hypothetical protein
VPAALRIVVSTVVVVLRGGLVGVPRLPDSSSRRCTARIVGGVVAAL